MADEITGLGTKVYRKDDLDDYGDPIASVANVTPPGLQREVVEVEDLAPQDDVKKKRLGAIEIGDFTLTLNFDPQDEGHEALQQDLEDGVPRDYKLELPDGGFYEINATVVGFVPQEISAGAIIQAEVTFNVESKPDYTPPPQPDD